MFLSKKNLLVALFSLPILSCGPASEYVNVKVITPIGMNEKFHELKDELMPENFMVVTKCTQRNLMIGYRDIVSNQLFGKKFSIQLTVGTSYPLANPSDILKNATLLEPLIVPILKGRTVDMGMLGAVYDPIDNLSINELDVETANTADGICDSLETTGSTAGNTSYSVNGHKTFNPSDSADTVTLDVGVANTNVSTITVPAPPSTPGSFVCPAVFSSINDCTIRDYVSFSISPQVNKTEIRYLFNDGALTIRHQIKNSGFTQAIVARFLPVTLFVGSNGYLITESTPSASAFNDQFSYPATFTKY